MHYCVHVGSSDRQPGLILKISFYFMFCCSLPPRPSKTRTCSHAISKMRRCEDAEMRRWEDAKVRMRTCEQANADMQMWPTPPITHHHHHHPAPMFETLVKPKLRQPRAPFFLRFLRIGYNGRGRFVFLLGVFLLSVFLFLKKHVCWYCFWESGFKRIGFGSSERFWRIEEEKWVVQVSS